jgi:hypothetical protein
MASREKTESRVFHQRTFQTLPAVLFTKCQLLLSDGMRMPVCGGMRYAPKLSTRSKRKEIKETGNEED